MIPRRAALALPALLLGACSPQDISNRRSPTGLAEVTEGVPYRPGERGSYDLYTPPNLPPEAPLVIFFYGGGWRSGSRADHAFVARPLLSLGGLVAIPDYRLVPAGRWPVFMEDGAAAVTALREGPGRGRPVVLIGHSAGAFIAVALAADPRWLGRTNRDALAGAVGLAGPYEYGPEEDWGVFVNAPGGRARAAPPDEAAMRGGPPLLLLQGEADNLVRPSQATRFGALARAQGVAAQEKLYPGVGHVGILTAIVPAVRGLGLAGAPVLEDIAAWLPGVTRRRAA